MIETRVYAKENGKEPFNDFLDSLGYADRARIEKRIDNVEKGNLGDHKFCGVGVNELRCFFGPGYRIYYGIQNELLIILLCAGDKKSQKKDVKTAQSYWANHKERRKTK